MGLRASVFLATCVVLGSGVGYAASSSARDSPIGSGVPAPVAAAGPSLPTDPVTPYEPDSTEPALQPDLPLTTDSFGSGDSRITYPVPQGWRKNPRATNEAKWKNPGTSNNTYVLRVEQITSQHVTVDAALTAHLEETEADQDDFVPVDRGTNWLEYTYRSDEGNARHSFIRWRDLDGDEEADVEIVVHGRAADVEGARALIRRVAEGVRQG